VLITSDDSAKGGRNYAYAVLHRESDDLAGVAGAAGRLEVEAGFAGVALDRPVVAVEVPDHIGARASQAAGGVAGGGGGA
jgi:hypothetical protein